MNRKAKITNIIKDNFNIKKCTVTDVSKAHKGHSEYIEGEETHFEIFIISNDFVNKTKLDRQRMVNKLLKNEFIESLHSVTYKLMTVNESNKI